MTKRLMISTIAVLLMMAISLLAGCTGSDNTTGDAIRDNAPIRVGAVIAMTGSNSIYGEQAKRGMELAIERINSGGGINGRPLEITLEDSRGDAKTAMTAFEKLRGENVRVYLTLTSAVALAIAPLANKDHVIQMEMGAVAPKYATPNDYTFRTAVNAHEYSKGITTALIGKGIKEAGTIQVNSEWGAGMGEAFKKSFEAAGGRVTQTELFDEGAADMNTQLLKLKSGDFQNVVLTAPQPEAGRVLKQAAEIGLGKQFYSDAYSVEGQIVLNTAGKAADGVLYVTPKFDAADQSEAVQKFVTASRNRHNATPAFLEAQAYDAVGLVAQAMRGCADPLETECLKAALAKTSGYAGASGTITFDENGDPVGKKMGLKTINDGKYVEAEQ